jgi:hypothetical protein
MPLKAVYDIAEIAAAANITTRRMRRLLLGCRVEMFRAGRRFAVPADELREKIPALWRNLTVPGSPGRVPRQESDTGLKKIECVEDVGGHGSGGPPH